MTTRNPFHSHPSWWRTSFKILVLGLWLASALTPPCLALDQTLLTGSEEDPDNDGSTNADEALNESNPNNPNTDGDKLPDGTPLLDGNDAVPIDAAIRWKKAPEVRYAAISLATSTDSKEFIPVAVGNDGSVVLVKNWGLIFPKPTPIQFRIWKNGGSSDLSATVPVEGFYYVYDNNWHDPVIDQYVETNSIDIYSIRQISITDDGDIMLSGGGHTLLYGHNTGFNFVLRWKKGSATPILLSKKPVNRVESIGYRTGPDTGYYSYHGIYSGAEAVFDRKGNMILLESSLDHTNAVITDNWTINFPKNNGQISGHDSRSSFSNLTRLGNYWYTSFPDGAPTKTNLVFNGSVNSFPGSVFEVLDTPSDDFAVVDLFEESYRGNVFINGAWVKSKTMPFPGYLNAAGYGFARGGGGFWRNGKSRQLDVSAAQFGKFASLQMISVGDSKDLLNDHGLMIGRSVRSYDDNGVELSEAEITPVLLIPVDLAVDANRDGVIKFSGNFDDSNLKGKPQDTTSESKPFRFWCNDDDDTGPGGSDTVPPANVDSRDNSIGSIRDLEDLARLHINIGGLQDAIAKGDIEVGLEWRNIEPVNGSNPSIRIYQAAEADGGLEYLKNTDKQKTWATNQRSGTFKDSLGPIVKDGSFKFKKEFWDTTEFGLTKFSSDKPNRYLLFEGWTEGKGQLVLTFWKGGIRIGEGGGVWLDIKNIKKMYVRAKADPHTMAAPYQEIINQPNEPNISWVADPNSQPFEAPANEARQVIVFVHGINGPGGGNPNDSYNGWINVAETVFKRLWQEGYKGRFAFYKWPALTPAFDFEYNESEYRAFKSGKGLAGFLGSFPAGYKKNIYSFSQGAVVCGAALAVYGGSADNYVMSQAAMPAGSYDTSAGINNYGPFILKEQQSPTPNTYLGYLTGLNVTGSVVSFYNTEDYALKTGTVIGAGANWEANQLSYKPNWFVGRHYEYNLGYAKLLINDSTAGRFVNDVHEKMAFVARPRSEAAGANTSVGGSIESRYSVGPQSECNFNRNSSDHGGQFSRPAQEVWPFYKKMLDIFSEE